MNAATAATAQGPMRKKPTDAGPQPARNGWLGMCQQCHEPAATHWDTKGRFIGCPDADPDTEFILITVNGARNRHNGESKPGRRTRRDRHFALPTYPQPGGDVVGQQKQIYDVIVAAGETGLLSADITRLTGIKNQSLQQPLKELRRQGFVKSVPDNDPGYRAWITTHTTP